MHACSSDDSFSDNYRTARLPTDYERLVVERERERVREREREREREGGGTEGQIERGFGLVILCKNYNFHSLAASVVDESNK